MASWNGAGYVQYDYAVQSQNEIICRNTNENNEQVEEQLEEGVLSFEEFDYAASKSLIPSAGLLLLEQQQQYDPLQPMQQQYQPTQQMSMILSRESRVTSMELENENEDNDDLYEGNYESGRMRKRNWSGNAKYQDDYPGTTTTIIARQKSKSSGKVGPRRRVDFSYNIPQQVPIGPNIQILGELVVDLNIFSAWDLMQENSSYMSNKDLPWNMFRPAQRIEEYSDGAILSYHDTASEGRLNFVDIVEYMYKIPDQNAHGFAEKLAKYQNKIISTQKALTELKLHYSTDDLAVIFTEVQVQSLKKVQSALQEFNKPGEDNLYLYAINTIHPTNLLQTPIAMGQSTGLVEMLGGGNEAYKMQMLRKGFLNFCSLNAHLQLLLISTGVEKEVFLEQRTIEGLIIPFKVTMEKRVLQSIKLNPVNHTFNSILVVYLITVEKNVLRDLSAYRETNRFEGLQDDLSYMMDCQLFLSKHYKNDFDVPYERRCNFKRVQPGITSHNQIEVQCNSISRQ